MTLTYPTPKPRQRRTTTPPAPYTLRPTHNADIADLRAIVESIQAEIERFQGIDTAADAALSPGKEWWERLNVIADAISARRVFPLSLWQRRRKERGEPIVENEDVLVFSAPDCLEGGLYGP